MRTHAALPAFALALTLHTLAPAARAQDAAAPAALAASAASPAAPERTKVLVMDIAAAGLEASVVENITGLTAVILAEDPRLDVLSGADVKRMAELEGEKQSLGCTNDASCLAEIAGAMGAGLVVYGNGGKLGTLLNLNLNLFDAAQARSVGRVAVQARSLEELPEKLRPALEQLVTGALGPRAGAVVAAAPPPEGPGVLPLALAGGGAAVGALGVVLVVVGVLPAADIGTREEAYRNDPTQTQLVTEASDIHDAWYKTGLAPGLIVGGAVLAAVGLGAAGAGVMMMGGAE